MNDRQIEWLRQYQQLKAAFEKYPTIWNGNVSLSADYSLFLLNLASIETQAVNQGVNTAGIGKVKQALRFSLIEQATLVATAVRTFAHKTGDQELVVTAYYQESSLKKIREMDLVTACQIILDKASPKVASLRDYGVNTDTLAELQTNLTQFKNLNPQPKTAILTTKAVTKTLTALFRDTNQLVKINLDGTLLQYRKKASDFYTAYSHARAVGRSRKTKKVTAEPVKPVVQLSIV